MSDATTRFALPLLMAGQAQNELTHNEALALLDLGLGATVLEAGRNDPPPTPAPGQAWLLGSAPTGVWTGHARALAGWTDGGWRFLPARTGLTVWIADQQLWAVFDGTSWNIGDHRCERILIGGVPVVGARQPAVTAPTGGSTVDTEARAAIAELTARLVAHGLIAA